MVLINNILLEINKDLDSWMPIIILAIMIVFDLVALLRGIVREGALIGVVYFAILVVAEIVAAIIIRLVAEWILWVLLYAVSLLVYYSTKMYGGRRSFNSYLIHVSIFLVGRLLGRWTGVILISFPVLVVYYNTIYQMAMAIVPGSSPDSPASQNNFLIKEKGAFTRLVKQFLLTDIPTLLLEFDGEKWRRFLVFLWYTWGIQFPILVVKDSLGRLVETRVQGSTSIKIGGPGLICAQSHQAVGITKGVQFSRVDGPGIIYTRPRERIFDVVDLRTQLRSSEIEAISKDGNPFKAILSTSFAIDHQVWTVADYHRLQSVNPILKDGKELDHNLGSYPYSEARVRAALSTTGVAVAGQDSGTSPIHWDNWVLSQVEEAARFVLSQRDLDELWKPKYDSKGTSALNEIGAEIMSITKSRLQEWGIGLYSARIVNFVFPEDHPVIKQQLVTWRGVWKTRAEQTLTEGKAEAERLQQEAKAYTRSILLTSLAEGMQKTHDARPDLARNIIALRFISALEDLIQQQPAETIEEQRSRLNLLKQQILQSRNMS